MIRGENILVENMIVVYDDVDLPVGTIRVRQGGSAGGHHGIESILAHLGTPDFLRVRIGIGREEDRGDITQYVLEKIPNGEFPLITDAIRDAVQAIEVLVTDGIDAAMNRYNRKSSPE
jgi:PTH1 family peptidyl-tRNA hydrolase